jgi:hypothetical protein
VHQMHAEVLEAHDEGEHDRLRFALSGWKFSPLSFFRIINLVGQNALCIGHRDGQNTEIRNKV